MSVLTEALQIAKGRRVAKRVIALIKHFEDDHDASHERDEDWDCAPARESFYGANGFLVRTVDSRLTTDIEKWSCAKTVKAWRWNNQGVYGNPTWTFVPIEGGIDPTTEEGQEKLTQIVDEFYATQEIENEEENPNV